MISREIKDRQSEGKALGNLGIAYEALGDYAKAIECEQQLLAIAQEIKDRQSEGKALGNLGVAYNSLGNYAKAIKYGQQWLMISQEIHDQQSKGVALNNLGLSFLKLGQLAAAEQSFRNAIQVWESLRQDLGNNDANKVSIFEDQARTYRLLQEVLIAEHRPNTALEIAERGRARALVELLVKRLAADSATDETDRTTNSSALSATDETDRTTNSSALSVFPSVAQMQQIAKAQNATLLEYSIIYDDFEGKKGIEGRESTLYIWVIQPNGQITFRSVDLDPLWQQQNTTLAELVENSRKGIGVSDRGDRATLKISLTPEYLQQLHKQQSATCISSINC